ncbi:aromatic ring-hydroxylating dioxygenase subunit alpha [Streptomyces sp. DSM 42041]|uniref:Aromatic ring-hydroxylating dioxygenase subunit alpha n=1 Tax=Streptomyces hazeniae TaxID=3075538 RepID=A0ABU2P206_9ACTN|nr:aromatic ring-hydroxylating dioxygenase subunit alpha [Streptomyces sp. DSM 42041]MDT0382478.1 aromatic ring-hydroxylating dioxygenase subunit alpha [Streptomyces sp. DSM 42041]
MRSQRDVLDPALYEKTRLPREEAATLPWWVYTDQTWFEREMETMFRPAWHFAGLASSVPDAGDFRTLRLLDEPLLVVRGDDLQVRVFRNSCRHRGSLVVGEPSGSCRGLRCPYHSWTYSLEGVLKHAPGLEGYRRDELAGLGKDLLQVPSGVREGLIFVHLGDPKTAAPLDAYLGNYLSTVAVPHQTAQMVATEEREYTLDSNWKLYAEVDMETLHTKHIHRGSIGEQPVTVPASEGDWIGVYHESAHTPALHPGERKSGFPHTTGLSGPATRGAHFSLLLPGFFLVTAQDVMWWIHKLPDSATRTRVRVGYSFPASTLARPDFDEVSKRYYKRLNQVVDEDDWITEYQQRGLNGSAPGCYVPEEHVVHRLDNWILDRVLGV